jgi:hypothetical protein
MQPVLPLLRLFGGVLRLGRRTAMFLVVVIMLVINIATMTIPAIATAVSAAAGAVGITTVAARQAASFATEKARTMKQAAELRNQRSALASARRTAASRADIIRSQRKAIVDTGARVSARMARGAARSVSTSFGQSIPVAGAAVVVGVTALELRDACETMKDLAALETKVVGGLKADPELAVPAAAEAANAKPAVASLADPTTVCGRSVPSTKKIWARIRAQPAEIWSEMRDWNIALPDWSPDFVVPELGGWIRTFRNWWSDDADMEGTQ